MTQSQAWLLIVVGLILAGLLYLLQPVLTPFLVGIGIAYLADPFADRLEARGWPRSMATLMVFLVLILLLIGLFLGIYPLLIKQIQTLVQMQADLFVIAVAASSDLADRLRQFG